MLSGLFLNKIQSEWTSNTGPDVTAFVPQDVQPHKLMAIKWLAPTFNSTTALRSTTDLSVLSITWPLTETNTSLTLGVYLMDSHTFFSIHHQGSVNTDLLNILWGTHCKECKQTNKMWI